MEIQRKHTFQLRYRESGNHRAGDSGSESWRMGRIGIRGGSREAAYIIWCMYNVGTTILQLSSTHLSLMSLPLNYMVPLCDLVSPCGQWYPVLVFFHLHKYTARLFLWHSERFTTLTSIAFPDVLSSPLLTVSIHFVGLNFSQWREVGKGVTELLLWARHCREHFIYLITGI